MSIYGAMISGVSGLKANSQSLGIISDNISNLNTVGYKETETRFSTLVASAGGLKGAYSPGGVLSSAVQRVDRQGVLQASDSGTDIAISGRGFFVVHENFDPAVGGSYLYTRAGQFSVDSNGYLVNTAGYYLQGWPTLGGGAYDVDQDGVADAGNPDPTSLASLSPVRVTAQSGTATATTQVDLGLNLPASAAVGDVETLTVRIYDSLGVGHNMALEWAKAAAAPATWDLNVTAITNAETGAASTTLGFPINVDQVVFNGDGTPASFTPAPLSVPGANWTTGAATSTIAFDLGTANQANGITQFASTYSINSIAQDGVTFGRFQSIEMNADGSVLALFDNGNRSMIYRLPVAVFSNPSAMQSKSGNAWAETEQGGAVFLNPPGNGTAGTIAPATLEASTVDLGEEFTSMIVVQRAFSASSRTITTADEMLEELVRIKR
ncbi:MAG: flagellar hook protein FlgE [Alphaproteobacteria bacterium]